MLPKNVKTERLNGSTLDISLVTMNAAKIRTNKISALNNPFATRHVSPGEIPYFFSSDRDFHQIIKRADKASWTGQIVGPHGSGKTTLVRHLSDQLKQHFTAVEFFIVRGTGEVQVCPRLKGASHPVAKTLDPNGDSRRLYVIDGIERLSWLQRKLLVADCRRKKIGLLVTAHRRLLGLPVFFETSFDQLRFGKILSHLGTQQYEDRYEALSNRFGNNCREMLFELYDDHLKAVNY